MLGVVQTDYSASSSALRSKILEGTIESEKIPALDVPTRWNSTFSMLDVALEVRPAFERLADEEASKYKGYFDEEDRDEEEETETEAQSRKSNKRVGPPGCVDWEKAAVFVKFLRVFYDVTMRVRATNSLTAHKTFHDVVAVEAEIDGLSEAPKMSNGSRVEPETQHIMLDMAGKMRTKFRKYFGTIEDMNQLVLVALVLDPRFKLKNISHICIHELNFGPAYLLVSLTDLYRTSSTAFSKSRSSKTNTGYGVPKAPETSSSKSKTKNNNVKMSGKMAEMLAGWQKALAQSNEVVVESGRVK